VGLCGDERERERERESFSCGTNRNEGGSNCNEICDRFVLCCSFRFYVIFLLLMVDRERRDSDRTALENIHLCDRERNTEEGFSREKLFLLINHI